MSDTAYAAVSLVEGIGNILCVWNRRYRGWSLPGGKVEPGETPEQAQARELEEEAGLLTRAAQLVYSAPSCVPTPAGRGSIVLLFRVDAIGEAREVEEGCPIRWMTREEFLAVSPFAEYYRGAFAAVPAWGTEP